MSNRTAVRREKDESRSKFMKAHPGQFKDSFTRPNTFRGIDPGTAAILLRGKKAVMKTNKKG